MFCVAAAAAASTLLVLFGFEANTVIAARIEPRAGLSTWADTPSYGGLLGLCSSHLLLSRINAAARRRADSAAI